jgi:hypothetical protein
MSLHNFRRIIVAYIVVAGFIGWWGSTQPVHALSPDQCLHVGNTETMEFFLVKPRTGERSVLPPTYGRPPVYRWFEISHNDMAYSPQGTHRAFFRVLSGLQTEEETGSTLIIENFLGEPTISIPVGYSRNSAIWWSPNGTMLSFISEEQTAMLHLYSRDGQHLGSIRVGSLYSFVGWSHDSNYIAFLWSIGWEETSQERLVILDVVTFDTHFTPIHQQVGMAVFSPRENRIAYVAQDDQLDQLMVADMSGHEVVVDVTGFPPSQLSISDRQFEGHSITWTADGQHVVYFQRNTANNTHEMRMASVLTSPVQVTTLLSSIIRTPRLSDGQPRMVLLQQAAGDFITVSLIQDNGEGKRDLVIPAHRATNILRQSVYFDGSIPYALVLWEDVAGQKHVTWMYGYAEGQVSGDILSAAWIQGEGKLLYTTRTESGLRVTLIDVIRGTHRVLQEMTVPASGQLDAFQYHAYIHWYSSAGEQGIMYFDTTTNRLYSFPYLFGYGTVYLHEYVKTVFVSPDNRHAIIMTQTLMYHGEDTLQLANATSVRVLAHAGDRIQWSPDSDLFVSLMYINQQPTLVVYDTSGTPIWRKVITSPRYLMVSWVPCTGLV